jgi:hypothetical protein
VNRKSSLSKQSNKPAPRWLTLAHAATYSGVTSQTLRNWSKGGSLTLHNVTPNGTRGRVLVDRHKLDALIESFANAPSTKLAMNERDELQEQTTQGISTLQNQMQALDNGVACPNFNVNEFEGGGDR